MTSMAKRPKENFHPALVTRPFDSAAPSMRLGRLVPSVPWQEQLLRPNFVMLSCVSTYAERGGIW